MSEEKQKPKLSRTVWEQFPNYGTARNRANELREAGKYPKVKVIYRGGKAKFDVVAYEAQK